MDATDAGADKRSRDQLDDSPLSTPSKGTHLHKCQKPNEDSGESILAAINMLCAKFDKLEDKLEDINHQIKENSRIIGSLTTAMEFHASELKDCKSRVTFLEEKVVALEKENATLKESQTDQERYSRRWYLRIKGMEEVMNENTREEVIKLLQKVEPHGTRVGRKDENRMRQVVIQYVKRHHWDPIWKATKASEVCKAAGVRFGEDLTTAEKQAREAL